MYAGLSRCHNKSQTLQDLNPTAVPVDLSIALGVVTFVGLAISMLCLIIFTLTFFISK